MKKVLFVILGILLVALLISVPHLIRVSAQKVLQHSFKGSYVSVGYFSVENLSSVSLSDIHIESGNYSLSFGKAILSKSKKLTLIDPLIHIEALPQITPIDLPIKKTEGQKPLSWFNEIDVQNLDLDCKLPQVRARVHGDFRIDLAAEVLRGCNLSISSLTSGKLTLNKASLHQSADAKIELLISEISFEKFHVKNIRGWVRFVESRLRVDSLEASLGGGRLSGNLVSETSAPYTYTLTLDVHNLDLDKITDELELRKKMTAKGMLIGKIKIIGDQGGIRDFSGRLSADARGGDLVIEDRQFLEHLAANVRQPIELVEAGFKDYHFDTGTLSLSIAEKDLDFLVQLNGAKGKRDVQIKLHDLF